MELAQPFISIAQLSNVELRGHGLECMVFKAESPDYGSVALRIPRTRIIHNVNDSNVDARGSIKQELRIHELLYGTSVPVPRPYKFLEVDGYPAMLCEYVEDDGSQASPEEVGRVAALIHTTCIPQGWDMHPVAHEGTDAVSAIVQRIERRYNEFVKFEPQAIRFTPEEHVLRRIANQLRHHPPSLLHMDFRAVNLRIREGRVVAVIDWSNAMVGPAAIDVFRILEIGEPGEGFVQAYKTILGFPEVSVEEETFLRLDAALMLALVFISEAPDLERRGPAVERVEELAQVLQSGGQTVLGDIR